MADELVREHLRRWAEELVDLTRRNRLLYFKHSASTSLEFAQSGSQVIQRFDRGGWGFYLPDPPADDDGDDDDNDDGFDPGTPAADELVVDMTPVRYGPKIERGLKNLAARANAEFLDAGLWVLYLGLGTLSWRDVDDKPATSPLLLMPVDLQRSGPQNRWRLELSTDGEPAINPALAVKLEKDFGLQLPSLDDLAEADLPAVLAAVTQTVRGTDWHVEDRAVLTTFTFQKEVIYRDLYDNEDEIVGHEMVQLLAEGPSSSVALDLDFAPEDEAHLDERHPPEELGLVLDADSTQRQCVIAARAGRSFVMDGPPGTGKSQTITNAIAQLLLDGKTVLFVSEKAAALEVVQNRLASLSLDPFVLPLHSHTATRKAIATELGRSLQERLAARSKFDSASVARLQSDRKRLSDYAVAMNVVRQPLDRSLHDVIGRVSQLDDNLTVSSPDLDLRSLDPAGVSELRGLADQLGRAWGPVERSAEFVWRDLRTDVHRSLADRRMSVERCQRALEALEHLTQAVEDELRLDGPSRPADCSALIELLELVERRFPIDPSWLTATSPQTARADVESLISSMRGEQNLRTSLDDAATEWSALPFDSAATLADAEEQLAQQDPSLHIDDDSNRSSLKQLIDTLEECIAAADAARSASSTLADIFGVPVDVTIEQARKLAQLSQLAGSPAAPEPQWLNPVVKAALEDARRVLAELLTTYRARRDGLHDVFTEEVLALDLTGLRARFEQVHKGLRKLSGSYRADKAALASVTTTGKVTKDVLAKLDEAIEWQLLANNLSNAESKHAPLLGDRYYPSRQETDLDEIERAIAVADQALALADGDVELDRLSQQISRGGQADPRLVKAGADTLQSLKRFDDAITLVSSSSAAALENRSIGSAKEWCSSVTSHLRIVAAELSAVCDVGDADVSLGLARNVLTQRADHARLAAEIESGRQQLAPLLGALSTEPDIGRLTEAVEWVSDVVRYFDGPVRSRTAPLLLRTSLTSHELRTAAKNFDNAKSHFLEQFQSPQDNDIDSELLGSFDDGRTLLALFERTVGDVAEWESYSTARDRLFEMGWSTVVLECEEQRVPGTSVGDILERTILHRWVELMIADDDRLLPHRAVDRDVLQRDFAHLDESLVHDAAARVINTCADRRPRSLAGQAGIINQQSQLKRRHKPVRTLLAEAGEAAQRLKPCFMMSPLSVSQFLPPGLRFDVVIFDEASQVREADAVCCVYRGDQLIVAGDPRQLPPTSFFQRTVDADEDDVDDEVLDFESILDRCKAQGFPSLPLNWHYRSRHESLITFSNYSFYDGRLHTFPGAAFEAPDLGVELFMVDGEYRRGGTRDNPIEAEKTVDRIVHHRRAHPELTLGVVTLSVPQQTCIEAAIERRADDEPELSYLMTDDRLDGFFVKNLENVQGDERDIILISIGYGPDENGKTTMNFGPMSRPGGERRLNVAVTRARRRVELVSSISSGQFKTDNVTTQYLARYLDYADRGPAALALELGDSEGDVESPFEEEVLRSVRGLGYDVVPQVGVAGYRIDLGVRHPGKSGIYVLGIECDGAAYHSSKVARDRDRLRQEVLEGLGWRMHRIWSTAWFTDRATEVERIKTAIEDAVAGAAPDLARSSRPPIDLVVEETDFEAPPDWAYPYSEPQLGTHHSRVDFIDPAARKEISEQIAQIVSMNGPIHVEQVLTAVRTAWGIGRAGDRIRYAFNQALAHLETRGSITVEGAFLSEPGQPVLVRVPAEDGDPVRKVVHVPPSELREAVIRLLDDAGSSSFEQLRLVWARLFGWRRIGADIMNAFDDVIDELIKSGEVEGPEPLRRRS